MAAKVLECEELCLYDSRKRVRFRIYCDPADDRPRLCLIDGEGNERLVVSLTGDGVPTVNFLETDANVVLGIQCGDALTLFRLNDRDGAPKCDLEDRDGVLSFGVYDDDRQRRVLYES